MSQIPDVRGRDGALGVNQSLIEAFEAGFEVFGTDGTELCLLDDGRDLQASENRILERNHTSECIKALRDAGLSVQSEPSKERISSGSK